MTIFVKKPCEHCPYRKDVKPFLTTERAVELAFMATDYSKSFVCHKKMKRIGEDDDDGQAIIDHNASPECAGFLSLMKNELGLTPFDKNGFEKSDLVYDTSTRMALSYKNFNESK